MELFCCLDQCRNFNAWLWKVQSRTVALDSEKTLGFQWGTALDDWLLGTLDTADGQYTRDEWQI